jgi:3-isopropylmalate/(R)-2-methylmalate dehydratase large subunit
MYDKITGKHTKDAIFGGGDVLELDWVWCHEITTPNAILDARKRGCDVVFDRNKVKAMIDHVNPAKDTASAIQGKIVREWAAEHGIEFLDVGRNGVCHAIIPEKGWINPGNVGIMGDSHTCTHGAFGALAVGVGTTELQNGIATGLWICPEQQVIRVNFTGKLPWNVFAKDLILRLIKQIGVKGATNAVLEFGGNVISEMNMEGRMTIANMAVEAGATSGMMLVDEKTIRYLWPSLKERYRDQEAALDNFSSWNSDLDAKYFKVIDVDVTDMVPAITYNYSPGEVADVKSLEGRKVNQVYIGSCTNGRISDLRIAASIIKFLGGKIDSNVRCVVVPATQLVYEQALKEGLIETFVKAGCFVSGPTCGACLGMSCGVIAPEEVCVSTTNRNFPGRMGKDGMVHLVSPATAATTAMEGVITEPDNELCRVAVDDEAQLPVFRACPTDWKNVPASKPDYAKLFQGIGSGTVRDFSGEVFYLPADNVDTDQIIPAKYLNETKKEVFGQHCLEDAPISPADRPKLYQSKILVVGDNFGCGSSREHAPWALAAAGIRCVIAPSFARIFRENMFANGLLCIPLDKETVDGLMKSRPEKISIDLEKELIRWTHKKGKEGDSPVCDTLPISEYHKGLVESGDSVGFMFKLAAELAA